MEKAPLYRFKLKLDTRNIDVCEITEYTNFTALDGTLYYKYKRKSSYRYCKVANLDICSSNTVYSFNPDIENAKHIFYNFYSKKRDVYYAKIEKLNRILIDIDAISGT